MTAALLHILAFGITLSIGVFACGVIHHMARTYGRKAINALRLQHRPEQRAAQ